MNFCRNLSQWKFFDLVGNWLTQYERKRCFSFSFSFDREGKKNKKLFFWHLEIFASQTSNEKSFLSHLKIEISKCLKRKTIEESAPFASINEVNSFQYKFNEILFKTVRLVWRKIFPTDLIWTIGSFSWWFVKVVLRFNGIDLEKRENYTINRFHIDLKRENLFSSIVKNKKRKFHQTGIKFF